ncbi:actin-related protein RO7 [Zymoseptoria brevis]|uniref:Actin-related protein RO7 n=1 Tax=Zymoseptoria brevis TaxID=1047168 RepID=A0A0F4GNE3_9PEZI|nr:actin-related protein RO7 [Zymoseptoria brevis]
MATSTTPARLPLRRGPSGTLREATVSPRSPHTPLLGRSTSSQFGSPGTFRVEQEDVVVYELGATHFAAGFAGESRPRCVLQFSHDTARRAGDYRQYDPQYAKLSRRWRFGGEWGIDHELYKIDLTELDLGLVEDKLERALRTAHIDYLQLDTKSRKAVLTVPSLLPNPLLELALRVLFAHYTQPPTIVVLTHPIMCCVSAGVRNALVVDIGWQETVVTAVGEYKEVSQSRSVRAGKMITREMGNLIEEGVRMRGEEDDTMKVTLEDAEDITQRMAWCQPRERSESTEQASVVQLPVPGSVPPATFPMLFDRLAEPVEKSLFQPAEQDDHNLPVHLLAYRVLLGLPADLRALCMARLIITGGPSNVPGLKGRILQELSHLVSTRAWDPVESYGSATAHHEKAMKEMSDKIASRRNRPSPERPTFSPIKMPLQESVPHGDRVHDDLRDPITLAAEQEAARGKTTPITGVLRGVETLGPWAGASLVAAMRIKGVHEVEREDFAKHGLKDLGNAL